MMLMASGTDLMTIFLGLEVLSVSLYVLAGFNRDNLKVNEAGSSISCWAPSPPAFCSTASPSPTAPPVLPRLQLIAGFAVPTARSRNQMFLVGMLLMAVGFSFKIAAAPFHMWAPDVYEGAPTPITAFMSVGPKAAGFAAFLRVFMIALPAFKAEWSVLLWVLAVLTMTVGNITALYQQNIKRMLAYSSIAHAGYVLVGFVAGNAVGTAGIMFYMLSYAFMNIGRLRHYHLGRQEGEQNNNVADYAGFAYKHPLFGMAMSIFLFSLAGIPPAAGFIGKFYLFSGAIQAGYIWLGHHRRA